VINAPEKKSKFKGMKSFIAYNLTPSVSHKKLDRDWDEVFLMNVWQE